MRCSGCSDTSITTDKCQPGNSRKTINHISNNSWVTSKLGVCVCGGEGQ
jgi:hypothetical protein